MPATLSIGDFARATHLTIKTLRHYHRVGILEPVDVDPETGYRRYGTEQIVVAQVIRRFRDLDMPLDDIRAVLGAPDVSTRNSVVASHLGRLEAELERTRAATESLRDLLGGDATAGAPAEFEHVFVPAAPAASITATIDVEDAGAWYQGALGELRSTLAAQGAPEAGPAGGMYFDGLFSEGRGRATVFIPCDPALRTLGRIDTVVIPPVELATTIHVGTQAEIDRAYGALAAHVAHHAVERRRADPRVLPGRRPRRSGPGTVAHPDRLADLSHDSTAPSPAIATASVRSAPFTGGRDVGDHCTWSATRRPLSPPAGRRSRASADRPAEAGTCRPARRSPSCRSSNPGPAEPSCRRETRGGRDGGTRRDRPPRRRSGDCGRRPARASRPSSRARADPPDRQRVIRGPESDRPGEQPSLQSACRSPGHQVADKPPASI